ncbi:MAG: helix-turn-helix domain-containing protein [Gemmataceae bacterium]|nr:helix-turn-helix domain-containing protein [Gemmataceae bacterium]
MATMAETKPAAEPAMLDVKGVAGLLGCSPRHVTRLAESGAMPGPVKLGALVRWDRAGLAKWMAAGCPAVRAN